MTTRGIPKVERAFGFGGGLGNITPPKKKPSEPNDVSVQSVSTPSIPPFDFSGGFFAQGSPASKFTGRPQTTAELEFIQDFVRKFGVRPSPSIPGFSQLQTQGQFLPGSTQFERGFRIPEDVLRAQRQGLEFGAFAGNLVPPGGVVTTSEEGEPLNRFFDINQGFARREIAAGRFVPSPESQASQVRHPTEGILQTVPSQFSRGFEGVNFPQGALGASVPQSAINQQITPLAPFQQPEPFTANLAESQSPFWRETGAYQLYGDALEFFLEKQKALGMSEVAAENLLDRAAFLIDTGVPANQLPAFGQVIQERNSAARKTYEELFRDNLNSVTSQLAEREFATKQQSFETSLAGRLGGGRGVQGRERPEYAEFVDSLRLSPESQDWLMTNFSLFYNQWIGSGAGISFIDYVTQVLSQ